MTALADACSRAMGWTGHKMKTADHGKTWTAVNP